MEDWKAQIRWNAQGLVPAIAQAADSGKVLMMAWMNEEALKKTLETGKAHYWSRSRQAIWCKGESSGHVQKVAEVRIDCDGDTLLLQVAQAGVACHTGHERCFYQVWKNNNWVEDEPLVKDPKDIYGKAP